MSNRAASFIEQWVSENAVKPVEGAPAGDDSEARLRAEACLAAAKEEGIAPAERAPGVRVRVRRHRHAPGADRDA